MKEVSVGKELYGMVIDLDKCTGCGACAVACMAENNLSFREDETDKLRTTTWMRLYRLNNGKPFPGDPGRLFAPALYALPAYALCLGLPGQCHPD